MFRACATIGGTQREEREEAAFFKPKSARPGGHFFESLRLSLHVSLHSDSRTSPNAMAVSLSYGHLVRRGGYAYVTTVPDQIHLPFRAAGGQEGRAFSLCFEDTAGHSYRSNVLSHIGGEHVQECPGGKSWRDREG